MALNTKFVVGINLNEYFVDKDTGLPLSGGKIHFKKDNNRSVGKLVYMLTGSPPNYTYTALPNPVTLSSVGTVAISPTDGTNIAIYFYPYDENGDLDLYHVQVKDAAGNVQLERQAWPNVSANVNPLNQVSGESDNQIANSQFVDILFEQDQGITLEWTGAVTNKVFELAPGWDMIVSASDTSSIVINRLPLAGSLNINTNPPYALDILPEGSSISSIKLRQTLQGNPSIFANNTLSGFMLIASLDGLSHSISMTYSTSVPNVPKTIISAATGAMGYTSAVGTLDVGAGLNTSTPPDAATYIDIILPTTGHVAISSIQILPITQGGDAASYIQDSVQRQESYLSYYYNPLIQAIPVPSITQGWDFKANPAQWGSTRASTVVASTYLWDQTIIWQNNNHLVSGSRDAAGRLALNVSSPGGQLALVQYLTMQQMRLLLANGWSTLINAYTDNVGGALGTVSFYYTTDPSLPSLASSNLSLIATIDANGKPVTFHGNWTELPNPLLGENRFTIPYNASNTTSSIALNGWSQPAYGISSTATYAAIVIGFSGLVSTNIYFDSIAVTPGRLAVPFAPVSYGDTLRQMQYYYEKSYAAGVVPGTATSVNSLAATPYNFGKSFANAVALPPNVCLKHTEKRTASPSLTVISPSTGFGGYFDCIWYAGGVAGALGVFGYTTAYDGPLYGSNAITLVSNGLNVGTAYASTPSNAIVFFHYTIDARLGLF